ncbi:MAG TPA: glycosyltransferase [Gammaproteobacteria bacterium]|nr:glycosyltransferase [Gammaproteobacteria bacterium]
MKILHIISGLDTGGTELFLERLVQSLDRDEFSHAVVALRNPGSVGPRLMQASIPVYALRAGMNTAGLRAVPALRGIVREHAPDLIQGWMYHGNLGASLARWLAGASCPVVWNIRHSLDGWHRERAGLRAMIRLGGRFSESAVRILFNSVAAARQHERFGYPRSKSIVIPNGFVCQRFRPDTDARLTTRRELGFGDDTVIIGMVARYHPVKDHATFLQAAKVLSEQTPQARFLLVGRHTGRDNPVLRRLLEKHGLAGRVLALGEREDIPALMNAMDICVSSSRAEGFPNAVGEAMACGVPCVVTEVGASAELVGDTGRTVPSHAPEPLAAALLELVHAGNAQRRQLGMAARERILRHYEWSTVLHRYADCYKDVLAQS